MEQQMISITVEEYKELLLKEKPNDNAVRILSEFYRIIEKCMEYTDSDYSHNLLCNNMIISEYKLKEHAKDFGFVIKYLDNDAFMKMWKNVQDEEISRKANEIKVKQKKKSEEE